MGTGRILHYEVAGTMNSERPTVFLRFVDMRSAKTFMAGSIPRISEANSHRAYNVVLLIPRLILSFVRPIHDNPNERFYSFFKQETIELAHFKIRQRALFYALDDSITWTPSQLAWLQKELAGFGEQRLGNCFFCPFHHPLYPLW